MPDTWPWGPPLRYGWADLYNATLARGASTLRANILAAIALAESGGDIRVINNTPATGDLSVGAWQINYYGSLWAERTSLFGTPAQLIGSGLGGQAHAALVIAAGGFTPWSTYNSGAYRQYLHGAGLPGGTSPGDAGGGKPADEQIDLRAEDYSPVVHATAATLTQNGNLWKNATAALAAIKDTNPRG